MELGRTLQKLLKEKKLSVRQLATLTGINHSTLNEWKTNRTPRSMDDLKKVAQVLGVSVHFLLFGEDEIGFTKEDLLKKFMESNDEKEEIMFGQFEVVLRKIRKKQ